MKATKYAMRPTRLCGPAVSHGTPKRRGVKISQMAVRSLSVGLPTIGVTDAAASAKRAVMALGFINILYGDARVQ